MLFQHKHFSPSLILSQTKINLQVHIWNFKSTSVLLSWKTVKRQLRNAVFNKFCNNYYTLNSGPSDPSKALSGSQGDWRLTYQATTKAQEKKKHCLMLKIAFWSFKYRLLVRSPINDPYLRQNSHETIVRGSFSSRDREVDFSVTTVLEPPKNSMAGRWLKAFFFPHILTASQG